MSEMLLKDKLHAALEQQLNDHIAKTILKRGWSYYLDGNVNSVNAQDHETLYGVVQGSELYAVILDAGNFRYSSCTCPFNGFCKHMAAVYFQYFHEEAGGHVQAERAYFRLLGLTPASSLIKEERSAEQQSATAAQHHPGENGKPSEWLEWMESAHGESWKKCRHSLHALQPVLSSLKGLARDWNKERQRLHWSLAILFVLEQAEKAITTVDSFSRYYHEMSFIRMAEPWIEHLNELISETIPNEMKPEEEEWASFLTTLVKKRAVNSEQQLFQWSIMYMAICEKFAENRQWYEKELRSMLELTAGGGEEGDTGVNLSFVHSAIGLLYFIDKQDKLALEQFAKASFDKSQRIMYPCAAKRMEEGDWETVEAWMSFLFEQVHKVKNARTVGPFLSLCRRADLDRTGQPIWMEYMTQLLPYSYSELSEHLLDRKRYEEWADLQMLIGSRPEDAGAQTLREIAKLAPRALMPLYHQSVDALIQTRNRQGYKMAVKQLKKLERLYKSDKDLTRWNQYISGLVRKHQRLRAFQEELWKGKIVQ